jgi:hypothetical protein
MQEDIVAYLLEKLKKYGKVTGEKYNYEPISDFRTSLGTVLYNGTVIVITEEKFNAMSDELRGDKRFSEPYKLSLVPYHETGITTKEYKVGIRLVRKADQVPKKETPKIISFVPKL